jgi:GTP-binding protein
MPIRPAVYIGSFVVGQQLPDRKEPRVAFLGRSNVGKSSLINWLAGTQSARVSKTPGRTRALNLFVMEGKMILGDFPGYGYARVAREQRREWELLIEKFLTPQYFRCAVQVVDARHPGMESDVDLERWMIRSGLPHMIVLNKADKLNTKERVAAGREAQKAFFSQHLLFASTFSSEGKRELEKNLQKMISGAQRAALTE